MGSKNSSQKKVLVQKVVSPKKLSKNQIQNQFGQRKVIPENLG